MTGFAVEDDDVKQWVELVKDANTGKFECWSTATLGDVFVKNTTKVRSFNGALCVRVCVREILR